MNPKTIAIIGFLSYLLNVISSAEDLNGNLLSPTVLIVIAGVVTIIFVIISAIRLWKSRRYLSMLLVSLEIILSVLTVIKEMTLPAYGSLFIFLLNITKITHFLLFFYVIFSLWTLERYEKNKQNQFSKKLAQSLVENLNKNVLEDKYVL